MISMVNTGWGYRLLLFGDVPDIKACHSTWIFFLTQDHMRLQMSKPYFTYPFHLSTIGCDGDLAYYMKVNSKVLKSRICGKLLMVIRGKLFFL